MAKIAPFGIYRAFDETGQPLAGGKVNTYEAGTSTPKATYTTATGDVANANPVILDAEGYAQIWLESGSYKFVVTDANDVEQFTTDNIEGDSTGGFASSVIEQATNLTITTVYQNYVIDCTASLTLSLSPAATLGEGFAFVVKNSSAGNVTIDPDGAELINGAATYIVPDGGSTTVVCDGTGWKTFNGQLWESNSSGNLYTQNSVGFGTDAPSALVTVLQTATGNLITARSSDSGATVQIGADSGAKGFVRGSSNDNLILGADNGDDVYIDATNSNVSIGKAAAADASSILELTSTTKGFLPPRMTTTQRNAISSPATGLTIYNTTTGLNEVYSGSAWVSVGATADYMIVEDQKANGTAGGTFTAGAWQTRDLNTTIVNNISGASLSSNQVTLPAGTYFVDARATAAIVNGNKTRWQNVTDATTANQGNNVYFTATYGAAPLVGYFTIAGTKTFELQHLCQTTRATDGFGQSTLGATGGVETYSSVTIIKVA